MGQNERHEQPLARRNSDDSFNNKIEDDISRQKEFKAISRRPPVLPAEILFLDGNSDDLRGFERTTIFNDWWDLIRHPPWSCDESVYDVLEGDRSDTCSCCAMLAQSSLMSHMADTQLEPQQALLLRLRWVSDPESVDCHNCSLLARIWPKHYLIPEARMFLAAQPIPDEWRSQFDGQVHNLLTMFRGYSREYILEDFLRHLSSIWKDTIAPLFAVHKNSTQPHAEHGPRLLNSEDFRYMSTWLSTCKQSHPEFQCEPIRSGLELSAIDCHDKVIVPIPAGAPYVALSYVWGSQQVTQSEWQWHHMPLTIRDAAHVTTQLGYRYLWVDRYCIDQEDPEAKHQLIKNMNNVFAEASVTVVAAAGEDADHGLTRVSTIPTPKWTSTSIPLGDWRIMVGAVRPDKAIRESVWNTRGWTYQEGVLSRRTIVFTDSTIYMQCLKRHEFGSYQPLLKRCLWFPEAATRPDDLYIYQWEEYPERVLSTETIGPDHRDDGSKPWVRSSVIGRVWGHIAAYTGRVLTFESDSLEAFAGILTQFSKNESTPIYSCWGIPFSNHDTECMAPALGWYTRAPFLSRRPSFPSWSWVGWRPSMSQNYNGIGGWNTSNLSEMARPTIIAKTESGSAINLSNYPESNFRTNARSLASQRLSHVLRLRTWIGYASIRQDHITQTERITEDDEWERLETFITSSPTSTDAFFLVTLRFDIGFANTLKEYSCSDYLMCAFLFQSASGMYFLILVPSGQYFHRVGIARTDRGYHYPRNAAQWLSKGTLRIK